MRRPPVLGRERSDDEFLVEYVENELEVAHVTPVHEVGLGHRSVVSDLRLAPGTLQGHRGENQVEGYVERDDV